MWSHVNSNGRIFNPAKAFAVLIMIFAWCPVLSSGQSSSPPTDKKTVSDQYHGVTVTEDYRWLEDISNEAVKQWSDAQNVYAREYLDAVAARDLIKKQLTELLGSTSTDYYYLQYEGDVLFAFKRQPPAEQPFLITLESADDPFSEKVIVDLNKIDTNGTTSIDFYVPSRDGKLVAVSMSEFGSEIGTVYVFDVATGEKLSDIVPNVNGPTAGGDVAWNEDNSGFWYTRYPHKGERPDEDLFFYQQVYYHKLGTPTEEDSYAIGEEFPHIAEIELETSPDGQYIMASVANGDGGEYAHYLLDPSGTWTQITKFKDLVRTAVFGPDNAIIMLCRMDAPRGKILRLPSGQTDLAQAAVLVEPSEATIKSYRPTTNYLFVIDLLGGPSQMRIFDYQGKPQEQIPVMPISSLWSMVDIGGDSILFCTSSYTEPSAWYRFDPVKWNVTRTALFEVSPADFSDIEVVREFATSKDGTKIPVNIIKRKGTVLNGENPTLLSGYGGYGISRTPGFDAGLRLWFDQGGVYVVANLRGGGEYGEEWHLAGNLTKKQNVFDDFSACAQYLIDAGYTNPSKLVIEGGSNGGLLMGAAFTQHPELYAVVVSHVGIYDMLRVELDPNGVFNITEFGTVKNADHFKALYAYSPYHNVKDGAAYPAILFLTGLYDGRVNPAQSRKMTASMQAATSSGKPVLLRTSASTGHGSGTALSKQIEKDTDVYSFIISQLGMTFRYDK